MLTRGAVTIVYDGDGNRVSETVAGVTTEYLVDDLNPTGLPQVLDEIVSGSVTRTYAYGWQRVSENQKISGTWTPSFYGYDGHGNVRFLTNTSGTVGNTYQFDAFGNQIASTGTTPNNYLFSGEQFDGSTNLLYLRARYYRMPTGRFLTRDPVEGRKCCGLSWNPYIYVKDNPVNLVDPTGRETLVEFVQIVKKEVLPTVWFAVRLGCYVQNVTLASAELISRAVTGEWFPVPLPITVPCAVVGGLGGPPAPPGGW